MARSSWQTLNSQICACTRCPRLIQHCRQIAERKRRAYLDWEYWGRPVPNLGPARARLLIVGLAPGAHGANRTGRMFTGDRSGDWLFRAMHRAGFCNQAESARAGDGLRLKDCVITAVCHCAPPGNKPTAEEIANCQPFLDQTIQRLRPAVFLALGGLAWRAVVSYARIQAWGDGPAPRFGHGQVHSLGTWGRKPRWMIGSYHPSQQNTFTGRLTESMLDDVFRKAKGLIEANTPS